MTVKRKTPAHIRDLTPDPKNARRHNPRNIGLIAEALHEVGAARSIVIDEQDQVLAGNGTLEAAAEAGITKVQVVEADGQTLIAVRRRNLTPEQKLRLSLFDNRAAELADWNPDVLRELALAGAPLHEVFTTDELEALLAVDEQSRIEGLAVDRPVDVAWVLLAIPLKDWPTHQAAVEALQVAAKFSTRHHVYDYQSGAALTGTPSDDLVAASRERGDTGAVGAYRDADGVWQYVRDDELEAYRLDGSDARSVVVVVGRLDVV